jgi:MoaA/NifB/PqqE/SkfB family radical SAM enzyme
MELQTKSHKYIYLSFELTKQCCAACLTCHAWELKDDKSSLITFDEMASCLKDFSRLTKDLNDFEEKKTLFRRGDCVDVQYHGMVILTGGEPLLRKDDVFKIIDECYKLNIPVILLTNTLLIDDELFHKLMSSTLFCLTFSFESYNKEVHNKIKGNSNSFDKAVWLLKEYEKLPSPKPRINVNASLSKFNIDDFIETVYFLKSLKVPEILFQPIVDLGWHDTQFTKEYAIKDSSIYDKLVNDIIMRTPMSEKFWVPIIKKLKVYSNYLKKDPSSKEDAYCISLDRNIIVTSEGNYLPCHHYESMKNELSTIGIRDKNIYDYWFSKEKKYWKNQLKDCQLDCVLLNCHCVTITQSEYYIDLVDKEEQSFTSVIVKLFEKRENE